jgi:lysophospholipase L1-like esterase
MNMFDRLLRFNSNEAGGESGPSAGELLFDEATYHFVSTDIVDGNQAQWKNRNLDTQPGKNIIYNSSGLLPNEGTFTGGSFTQHFANGPNYTSSAARLNLNAHAGGGTSGSYYKPYFNRTLPVGSYTFYCKMKSNTVGVVQKVRWGPSTAGATIIMDVDDNWTQFSFGFTVSSAGANNGLFIAAQIGLGAQSILIDEMQLYSNLETVPAYIDDGNDGHAAKPYGIRNPITKNGNFVTNSTLALHSPSFPIDKSWSEMTAMFAVKIESDTTQILWSCITDAFYGSLNNVSLSIVSGEPGFPHAGVNRTGKLTSQGFTFIGFTFGAGSSRSWVNDVRVAIGSGSAAIRAQILSALCRLPATSPLLGDCAFFTIWDSQFSEDEWAVAIERGREILTELSATTIARNWYLAEGDSITNAFSAPQGESYAHRMATELFDNNEYVGHLNLGTGGHTLSFLEGELAETLVRISEVQAGGGTAIISVLIGRNDHATLISNAACDAYWVRLKAYYSALRNAGALVIAITALPSGTAATNGGPAGSWETYRNYLNGLIRGDTSQYDALADFGNPSVGIMGDVATCENTTYYSSDGVHPYPAGHILLAAIIKPIIQSLL